MSCGFLASGVRNVLGDGSNLGIRLRYVEEPRPLGTGGAVKYAESLLEERFLMLNGDVLTDLDVSAQLEQHEHTGARATLALIPVDDPSAYGLVRLEEDRTVKEFLEKPSPDQIDTDLINAGAYVLERDVLSLIPPGVTWSIERGVVLQGAEVGAGCQLEQCIVGAGARVGEGTQIDGGVVLGEGVTVGAGNVLSAGARIFPGVTLPDGAIRF